MSVMALGTGIGRWVKIEKARGAGYTCRLCGQLFQRGWQFYPEGSLTASASVCDCCADALLD